MALVVGAKAISLLGDEMATIALVLRLQSHGAGPRAVAALLIANLLPIVLLSGVVGRLVDRFDSRAAAGELEPGPGRGSARCSRSPPRTPAVLALSCLLGAGQAVNGATWQALLPTIASRRRASPGLSG